MPQRFSNWSTDYSPDFWKSRFTPSNLLKVTSYATSVLAQRLDARILEQYDILNLGEHTLGTCYIWVPIVISDTPKYLGDNELYPWEYEIDKNWLYIDCIYDKHVDPEINLQNGIDFEYTEKTGKLHTSKPIQTKDGNTPTKLYISKGWYSEYRIYNEIGHFLDYVNRDSTWYRDSIEPVLAAFYKGPTYTNILAVVNVMAGLPVAKFGDEVVTSINNGIVVTSKYSYYIGTVHTKLKVGDTLFKFQPLTDAVECKTNETYPNWWEGHPSDIFAKYSLSSGMTEDVRDYMMSNYLRNSVISVEFRQDRLGDRNITIEKPLYDILYKAVPIGSDIIYAQTYHVGYSIDPKGEVLDPNFDDWYPRLNVWSCYGHYGGKDRGEKAQFGKDVDLIGHGKIYVHLPKRTDPDYSEEKYLAWLNGADYFGIVRSKRSRFTFNNGLWHIRGKDTDGLNEFWRYESSDREYVDYRWKQEVLFEPWFELVHIRMESKKGEQLWPASKQYRIPFDLESTGGLPDTDTLIPNTPETVLRKLDYIDEHGIKHYKKMTGISGPGASGSYSDLNSILPIKEGGFDKLTISASTVYSLNMLDLWENTNITWPDKDGFRVGGNGDLGWLIGPVDGFNCGVFPKYITVTPKVKIPASDPKIYLEVHYSRYLYNAEIGEWYWTDWQPVPNISVPIRDPFTNINIPFTGLVKFKILMSKNNSFVQGSPVLSNFRVQTKKVE